MIVGAGRSRCSRPYTELYVVPSWSTVAAAQADGISGIIGLVGAFVMIGGALYLEHCCRAPGVEL